MKILVIFSDMLRANRLSTFNQFVSRNNKIDLFFKELGGTAYQNSFTPGPDTPRGMASFAAGLPPYLNGCDIRLKWPRYFLYPEVKSIYDIFLENGYKMDMLSDPRERAAGVFPSNISELNVHNDHKYDIEEFLNSINLQKKHFVFLSLPQFHWTLDHYGASLNGEKYAEHDMAYAFNKVFNILDKNQFDHIFIFSDHGFKFTYEVKLQPEWMLLNEDRTNNILFHRQKFDKGLKIDNRLCSLTDLYPTFESIVLKEKRDYSLLQETERQHVVIEDHINFLPEVNQNIELWCVATKTDLYIRTLNSAQLIDRKNRSITRGAIDYFDKILENESSYKKYKNEHDKVFVYRANLLNSVGDNYEKLYDFRRKKRPSYIKLFFKVKDIISIYLQDILNVNKH